VLTGTVTSTEGGQTHSFPIKTIIPQGFPFVAPKVFLDMKISMQMLSSKPYLGQMNAITVPYLASWKGSQGTRNKPTLVELMNFVAAVIASDPPIEQGFKAAMMGGAPAQPQGFSPYHNTQPQYQAQTNPYGMPPPPKGSGALAPAEIDSYSFEVLTNIDTMANSYVEQA